MVETADDGSRQRVGCFVFFLKFFRPFRIDLQKLFLINILPLGTFAMYNVPRGKIFTDIFFCKLIRNDLKGLKRQRQLMAVLTDFTSREF